MELIVTCEHAGNIIPSDYQHLFEGQEQLLRSHRGWDLGALNIAEHLSQYFQAPLYTHSISRLLIEVNRSLHSSQLFSEFSNLLPATEQQRLIDHYYHPYRDPVEDRIRTAKTAVLHLSIHSFTPIWNEVTRPTDIGLLFDPARKQEQDFCELLFRKGCEELTDLQFDFNQPYQGIDDGFTTYLRTQFSSDHYCGIEIEVNQKFAGNARIRDGLIKAVERSVAH
jgi:predicted N-formylglutamate amidohydrolase